ncbi:tetratricopeptide repeat protein [Acidihalobacter aeolianus]|nr:tetratricopeptide repeat protein [Acidihalobacter aeolianus]
MRLKLASAALSICMLLSVDAAQASTIGMNAFSKGVTAFRSGDYQIALSEFLHARVAGIQSNNLTYDLGSTYFKLGRYDEAAREFELLGRDPSLTALAHYNLGLIALRKGVKPKAETEFKLAAKTATSSKIRALAYEQLQRIHPTSAPVARWVGFANLGGGYDNNVSLLSRSSLIAAAGQGSSFVQFLAGAIGQITGTPDHGLKVIGTVYHVSYPALNTYNQTLLRVGLAYRQPLSGWITEGAGYVNYSYLHGAAFEQFNSLELKGWHVLPNHWRLGLKYRYSRITGMSTYAYLSGSQQQARVELRWHANGLDLRTGYEIEWNQRSNLAIGTQFYSASPTRNELYLRADWPVTARTKLFTHLSYQHSRYDSPDVTLQGATLVSKTRVDDRYLESLGAQYRLFPRWYLVGEYQHTHANSTFSIYSYDSDRYSLQIEHYF